MFVAEAELTMWSTTAPEVSDPYFAEHAGLLISSFHRLTGKHLIPPELTGDTLHQALFEAPFAVVSHDTAEEPIFNYGNLIAQDLFEMDWATLTSTPSRDSAESINRAERSRLLARVSEHGFIDDYRGVRISSTGRRFMIEEAMIWNIINTNDIYQGQAAALYRWQEI